MQVDRGVQGLAGLQDRPEPAVVEVLAEWLGVKRSYVEIVSGETSRNKVVLFRDITPEALAEMVADYE